MSQADDERPILSPEEEAEVRAMLEAALRPAELDEEVHERLLSYALEDPLAPPTDAELAEASRLREALATGADHADADLLRAAAAPFHGGGDAAAERALAIAEQASSPRRNVVYVLFGAASAAVAAAAAISLLVGTPRPEPGPTASSAPGRELVRPRSTAPLFDEPFATGDTSARMDRIASARSRDLRDNRYASWGVR